MFPVCSCLPTSFALSWLGPAPWPGQPGARPMTPDFGPELDPLRPDVRTGVGFDGNESRYTEEMGAEICRRLASGASLNAVCRDPAMPSKPAILKWAVHRPLFAAAMAEARARTPGRGEAAAS